MIITPRDITSYEIASRIASPREDRGATTLGRVLTLIIVVSDLTDVDRAIEILDAASREHPCRVIVIVNSPDIEGVARLNAQVCIGDTAGLSDVIVLEPKGQAVSALDTLVMPLLLSDTSVVTYWSVVAPHNSGEYPLGWITIRRITNLGGSECPLKTLLGLSQHHTPEDTDLGWVRVTLWRALLATIAAEFDQIPASVLVRGRETYPSSYLVAARIHRVLGVPVTRQTDPHVSTIIGVCLYFAHGPQVSLQRRASSNAAHLHRSDLATADVNLPKRSAQDCLMEESRRLDLDAFYEELLTGDLHPLPEAVERIAQ